MKLTIPGELCDLNTYVDAERTFKIKASKIKKSETEKVAWIVKGKKIPKDIVYPLIIELTWYVKDLRKDSDNITFAKKFIADGMVLAGLIPDDSRRYVRVFRDLDVIVDKNNPRIEILINKK